MHAGHFSFCFQSRKLAFLLLIGILLGNNLNLSLRARKYRHISIDHLPSSSCWLILPLLSRFPESHPGHHHQMMGHTISACSSAALSKQTCSGDKLHSPRKEIHLLQLYTSEIKLWKYFLTRFSRVPTICYVFNNFSYYTHEWKIQRGLSPERTILFSLRLIQDIHKFHDFKSNKRHWEICHICALHFVEVYNLIPSALVWCLYHKGTKSVWNSTSASS